MKRGMTLIELLVALTMSIILSLGLYYALKNSGLFFAQDKAISDLIEYSRTAEEQLKFYFDRWGNGVPTGGTNCEFNFDTNLDPQQFPSNRFCITKNASSPCDEIIFYGNTQGFLIVLGERDTNSYNALSCRMTSDNEDYYYVWRGENVIALTTGRNIGIDGGDCGIGGNFSNAAVPKQIQDINGNTISLQTGDAIIRVPKIIRIYCDITDGELYLKVSEREGDKKRPITSPLAPVSSMQAELLPQGCNPINGECKAVKFTITFVNRVGTREYTLTKDIILGR